MTYSQLIAQIGMSQREAARFLKVNERTSRRWASGLIPTPTAVLYLLVMMVRLRVGPEEVELLISEAS